MTERNDRDDRRANHRPAEGVRIIPAEEAQAALEAGAAAGRRPDDQLRFGDVPPAPAGPRPTHRFPLPTSVDPAEVPHPPVAAPVRPEDRVILPRADRDLDADDAHDLRLWSGRGRSSDHDEAADGAAPSDREGPDVSGRIGDGDTEGDPTVAVPAVPSASAAPPWSPAPPSFAPPSTAPAVAAAPLVRPGWRPDPPTEALGELPGFPPRPQTVAEAAGPGISPRADDVVASEAPGGDPVVNAEAEDGAWDTGAWQADKWRADPIANPSEGETDPTVGFDAIDDAIRVTGVVPASDGAAAATPAPDVWEPLPPPPSPTGWEPPPGWSLHHDPDGGDDDGGPGGADWDAPLPAPTWDSPLDSAEGISAKGHSWTPPEAWAEPSEGSTLAERSSPTGDPPAEPTVVSRWSEEESPWATPALPPVSPSPPARRDDDHDRAIVDEALPSASSEPTTPPDEGITVTGGFGTDLPHWTDPPTGEVPRLRPEGEADPGPDDLEAWQAVGSGGGARWRDDAEDWDDLGALGDLGSDETRVGALDPSRTEHSDLYSFDEEFERLDEERSGQHRSVDVDDAEEEVEVAPERISTSVRASAATRAARAARARPGTTPPGAGSSSDGRDLGSAIAVGVGFIVLLVVCYAIGSKALLVLSAAVLLACAVEVFGMVQRRGFKPATLLGLVATVGVVFAAYWRGPGALPLITVLVFVAAMLWYLLGVVEARPLANVSATLMAFVWVGLLGSFGALLLRAPHGKGLFLGAVLCTVASDIVAYLAGSRIGTRALAPSVSPGKTVEGVLAGGLAALVVGAIVGSQLTPWGGVRHGLELGLVVAVLAPVGDLFESMIKRDLSLKDSGSALPGHGGLLDRFDSLLIVLPAAYYLVTLFGLRL